ncbi:Zinc finger, B-box [Quillaja saponaria]|uniref:Zinc finger, B-box n=1 Tax=Quillaja saponaria TaxID=32244 RepID=A0AAD7M1X2_QUISA|nr:Zinc finger, B-box [Quillaja saponaria]
MKKCELCNSPANMYCESDQASLCWDCDARVHSANFLVAKHSRTLLCHVCQALTPWNGSGPKLGRTISICNDCVANGDQNDEDDDIDDDGESTNDEDEDDEENQVVPWSSTTPPPSVSSSSSSSESSSGFFNGEEAS